MRYEQDDLFLNELIEEMKLGTMAALGLSAALFTSPANFAGQRGLRNNNPGNIKKSSIQWKGAIGDDGTFVKFASPEDGIRALARIIKVYNEKYSLNTIEQIIGRWAPPSENNTKKYVEFVATKVGKSPKDKIDLKNHNEFSKLISAIIQFENGKMPYSSDHIKNGIKSSTTQNKKK